MTEYKVIVAMRLRWEPPGSDKVTGIVVQETFLTVKVVRSPSTDRDGYYQRCGGGRRVLRKKIGGDR